MANLQRGVSMRGLQMSMPLAKAVSRTTRLAILATLAMLPGISRTAHAQAPSPKRIIVRAGRVLDVRTGQMRANKAIVIEGEKIAQIVASSEVKAAAGDTTIDLPDSAVLPGLIDAHTHLTFELSSLGYQGLAISTAREALHGARNARITLEAGFTTVRNLGAKDYADIALRDAINEGDAIGPRILASGPALGITGGHCDENLLPFAFHHEAEGVADGVAAVQHKVREVIKYGADVIKICATGGVLSKGDDPNASQYTIEEMKAIVPEFSKQKMRDVAAAAQINAKKAISAGVKVAFGTDAAVYPHGLNAGEFHVYVSLGMTPLAAIQAATINASDLLGPKFLVGSLEPGKFGDVIAVDGDPSKDVTILEHVRFVMKGGTVYKNDYSKK